MSTYQWRRFETALTIGATGASADLMMTLHPGETIRRVILGLDYGIFDSTNEYTDLGTFCALGLQLGSSAISAPHEPVTDWASTADRWYYLEQMIFEVVNAQVVAGVTSYIARNNATTRAIDTRNNQKNSTAADEHLWLTTQVPSQVYTTGSLFGSGSTQVLVEVP